MPRRARTIADVRRRYDNPAMVELVATVCDLYCDGKTPGEIRRQVQEKLRTTLTREQPYQILAFAAYKGWLRFHPPSDYALGDGLREQHPLVDGVDVVSTWSLGDVAARGARALLQLVRRRVREEPGQPVHVGLAGGWTTLQTVMRFAELLQEPVDDLPPRLVFHAMVTGLQAHNPRTDPNSFFNYLAGPDLAVTTEFVAFNGPGLPTREMVEKLRSENKPTMDAIAEGEDIDIVVTSAASWLDRDHSHLRRLLLKHDPEGCRQLVGQQCRADVLWQPVDDRGPIANETGVQAMTLWRLDQVADAIDRGKKVLLVLGPCGRCGAPRGDVLRTMLEMPRRYVTDVVVDSRTARFQDSSTEPPPSDD